LSTPDGEESAIPSDSGETFVDDVDILTGDFLSIIDEEKLATISAGGKSGE